MCTQALLLLGLIASTLGQQFECELQMRTLVMRNGVVSGTFQMDSAKPGAYKINLPATAGREQFTEIVQFNPGNGFNGASALPYTDQIIFRSGTSCACETGYFDDSMPLLHPYNQENQDLLEAFYTRGARAANGCDVWTANPNGAATDKPITRALNLQNINVALKEIQIHPDTKLPCSATWDDGRRFTFSNCVTVAANTFSRGTTFKEPSNCKCGKPLDIVVVLDRSSSISYREFLDQRGFTIDFANQFDFDPLKANLAIINFQKNAWVHLQITDGISNANVNASVQSLGCPASCDQTGTNCRPQNNPESCCCCCGTCISCGQRLGAMQFPKGRSFAFKLLIVITDGFANHGATSYDSAKQVVNGGACQGSCDDDLKASVDFVYQTVNGNDSKNPPNNLALYAVGVGTDRDVSPTQLQILAGNRTNRVLRRNSFSELASLSVELISRSCDQNVNPCGGCCGFCLCGKCQAPDTCEDRSPCNKGSRPTGQVCCSTTPVDCTVQQAADKCSTYVCDDTNGQCTATNSVQCPPASNTTCFNRTCEASSGLCRTVQTGNCPSVKECVDAASCDDGNMCTNDTCDPDGACRWETVTCSANPAYAPDNCSVVGCDRATGCFKNPVNVTEVCNDNNVCTIDTCDPTRGCVRTPLVCEDDGNLCTDTKCDDLRGCIHIPRLCNGTGNTTCKIFFCNETDGNCTFKDIDCTPLFPVTTVIAGGLGALALVGIIIGVVLVVAGCAGGGAYAYVQASQGKDLSNVASNPLYQGSGHQGENPLFKRK